MAKLFLSGGVVQFDDADFAILNLFDWRICQGRARGYRTFGQGRYQDVVMSRFLLNAGTGQLVDHQDLDPLNNRRSNLRLCNKSQNNSNCRRRKHNTHPYKGVRQNNRESDNWIAYISVRGRQKYLGSYKSAEDAARAYDAAAVERSGDFARLNFPKEVLKP